jgi:ketosteroid isomerase-like protein
MPTDAEKVAIARDALAALGDGDHERALAVLDEHVRVRASGPLWSGRYRGVEGLMDSYRDAKRNFHDLELSIRSVEADTDGTVVVAGRVSGVLDGRGKLAAELLGVLWFRGRKVHRVYLRTRLHQLHRDQPMGRSAHADDA